MEPILSKTEIAQLISAIRHGDVSLSPEEETFQEKKKSSAITVNLFKLTKVDREQVRIPNFDIIIDIFSRIYSTSLTNQLQRTFTIRRIALETMELQEFMTAHSNAGAIGIFDMPPLPTGALLIFNTQLSFSVLEIMLGAAIEIESPDIQRRLTTLELNILKSSIIDVCPDLDKAFAQLLGLNSKLIKLENNTRMISIAEPEEEIIVATLQVSIRQEIGKIYMIFPLTTLDPLRAQLKELLKINSQKSSTWKDIFVGQIQEVPLSVIARSGELTRSVKEVLAMQVGDIIELDYDPNLPLQVLVENSPKFRAIPGTHNGNKAISLTGIAEKR